MAVSKRPRTPPATRDELEWRRQHAVLHGEWDAAARYAALVAAATPDHVAPVGRDCPYSHPLKTRHATGGYYLPGTLRYARTAPDRCFATAAAARAAGYRRLKR